MRIQRKTEWPSGKRVRNRVPDGLGARAGAMLVTLTGIALSVGVLVYFFLKLASHGLLVGTLDVAVLLTMAQAIAYAGYWLWVRDLRPRDTVRVAARCLLGVALAAVVSGWLLGSHRLTGQNIQDPAMFTLTLLSAGGVAGVVVVGVRGVDGPSLEDSTDRSGEELVVVNELLRHHVLNDVNVLLGEIEGLQGHVDEVGEHRVESIADRGERIAGLVQNLRMLTASLSETTERTSVDAVSVLRGEAREARALYPCLRIRIQAPDEARVLADEALGAVFEHLFRNAARNDRSGDRVVDVRVVRGDDRVQISVTDQSLVLRADPGRDPFGPDDAGDAHLGLYLVQSILDQYGGCLRYHPTGDGGSRLVLELPSAA